MTIPSRQKSEEREGGERDHRDRQKEIGERRGQIDRNIEGEVRERE